MSGNAVNPVVSISHLSKRFGATQALSDITMQINSGEVLALLGANGAGKSTIIKILAGIYTPDEGSITGSEGSTLESVRFAFIHQDLGLVEWMTVGESVALGSKYPTKSGFITWRGVRDMAEDALKNVAPHINVMDQISTLSRAEEGLFMELTNRENMYPNLPIRGKKFFSAVHKKSEKIQAHALAEEFNVKPRATELAVATLSGGNQQKVILSRWLSMPRAAIILEEPTAGVDVGAKGDIYELIDKATKNKLAILLVSTDFEEVALMAHRALVFSEGEIVKVLDRSEITVENLVTYASRANVGV